MSEQVSGFVKKVNERTGVGKRGPWTSYSVKLSTPDGAGERDDWLSAGFKKPDYNEGDYVSMNIQESKRPGQYDIVVAKKETPPAKPSQKATTGVAEATSAPASSKSWGNNRDQHIHYQSARKDAVEVLGLLVGNGALKVPSKTADAFDVLTAAVDKLTVQYYHDTQTLRLLDRVEDAGDITITEPTTAPVTDEDDE